MQEYTPFLSWSLCEQSQYYFVLSVKTVKLKALVAKTSKIKGEKTLKKFDQILGHEPLKTPLLSSNVPKFTLFLFWRHP